MAVNHGVISVIQIEHLIYRIRGQRVMLDADLARVYGVSTARLNQQVKRNRERFPEDFMFQLTSDEFEALMLQIATSKAGRGGRRMRPYAFTEHGAIMVATILNSQVAVRASIQVVRAFVRLREILATHKDLAQQLSNLESKLLRHDSQFRIVFGALRRLMTPPRPQRRRIGFQPH